MTKKAVLKIEEVKTEKQADKVIEYLAMTNKKKYMYSKAAEEFVEIADICLKFANKVEEYHPERQELVDELGDAYIRMGMLCVRLGLGTEVRSRIIHKADKYLKILKDGKYTRSI